MQYLYAVPGGYLNQRANYTSAFWDVVNWQSVSDLLEKQTAGEVIDPFVAFLPAEKAA